MTSILKVDQIQTTAGAAPTTKDLGFAAGSVLQVVHGTLPTTLASTGASGSDYLVNIGLSATITPKFSNSKILIETNLYVGASQSESSGYLQSYLIYKAGSVFNDVHGTSEGGRRRVAGSINAYNSGVSSIQYRLSNLSGTHMDTNVGTTSATTYSIYMRAYSSGPTVYVNRSQAYQVSSGGTDYDHNPSSTITLTEIAA